MIAQAIRCDHNADHPFVEGSAIDSASQVQAATRISCIQRNEGRNTYKRLVGRVSISAKMIVSAHLTCK